MSQNVPEKLETSPTQAHAVGLKGIQRRLDRHGQPRYRATAYVNGQQVRGPWTPRKREAQRQRQEMLEGSFPQPQRITSRGPQKRQKKVYFIRAATGGPVKIGYTEGPLGVRLGQLQAGNAEELKVIAVHYGGRDLETQLHQALRDHHVRGEWFALSEGLIEDIRAAASLHRANRNELENIDVPAARERLRRFCEGGTPLGGPA